MPRQGKEITQLVADVLAQARQKHDLIASTDRLFMQPDGAIRVEGEGTYVPNDYAHGQLAERLDIPRKYYDRMRAQAPELLSANVNAWFQKTPERRMLRTLTLERERPVLRAFLSDRYRRLDNLDVMQAVIPFMQKEYPKELQVVSCDATDTRLYIKVVAPHTRRDLTSLLKPGTHTFIEEPVESGFVVQNSEVGAGAIAVYPYVMILRCTNGAMVTVYGQRKYHTGKRQGGDDEAVEALLSDDTKRLEDAALFNRIKDIIRACLDDTQVNQIFTKLAETRQMKIEGKPEAAVEVLAQKYGLNEEESGGVLRTLIDSGMGLSQYGLFNAVTEVAKSDQLSYDRASSLEEMAGKLIQLPASEWKVISQAA